LPEPGGWIQWIIGNSTDIGGVKKSGMDGFPATMTTSSGNINNSII
jgi:hypothetical protein